MHSSSEHSAVFIFDLNLHALDRQSDLIPRSVCCSSHHPTSSFSQSCSLTVPLPHRTRDVLARAGPGVGELKTRPGGAITNPNTVLWDISYTRVLRGARASSEPLLWRGEVCVGVCVWGVLLKLYCTLNSNYSTLYDITPARVRVCKWCFR